MSFPSLPPCLAPTDRFSAGGTVHLLLYRAAGFPGGESHRGGRGRRDLEGARHQKHVCPHGRKAGWAQEHPGNVRGWHQREPGKSVGYFARSGWGWGTGHGRCLVVGFARFVCFTANQSLVRSLIVSLFGGVAVEMVTITGLKESDRGRAGVFVPLSDA